MVSISPPQAPRPQAEDGSAPQQAALPFKLDEGATLANFFAVDGGPVLPQLEQLLSPQGEGWIYLAGGNGSGVSHLLQACSAAAGECSLSPMYLSLAECLSLDVDTAAICEGLDQFDLLCIDDVDCLRGQCDGQEALFYLLEKLKAKPVSRLLLGGHCVASELALELPDLQSRLCWATGFQLPRLNDEQRAQALQLKSHNLGLSMSDEVAAFIVRRCSRDMAALTDLLLRLDRQALVSQRRLTIPWIKTVLDI